jgi:MoxR-like ATPase
MDCSGLFNAIINLQMKEGSMKINKILELRERLFDNLSNVTIGKPDVIDFVIMALISKGHILIEDIPGTGKTMLAKSLALSIDSKFSRIQFTPDMLPSDVTGVSFYNQVNHTLEFRKGPLFANIVLADEINRATPKTQSALLEGMEEKQITVDGFTHELPGVFLVIATQNPIDYEGTFKLPEAQLDRFLIKIHIGYPDNNAEKEIMKAQNFRHPINSLIQVITEEEILFMQEEIKKVHVSEELMEYIVRIINATRKNDDIYLGASPRGSLALYRLGQCRAAFNNRDYIIPDDIKQVSFPVLSHRIIFQPSVRMQEIEYEEFIEEIVDHVKVPGG